MPVLLPLEPLLACCNPITKDPWSLAEPVTMELVRSELQRGKIAKRHYDDAKYRRRWSTGRHARRIACLVRDGWSDPIYVDLRIDKFFGPHTWIIQDGNHRVWAAVYRGDTSILACVDGEVDRCEYKLGADYIETDLALLEPLRKRCDWIVY